MTHNRSNSLAPRMGLAPCLHAAFKPTPFADKVRVRIWTKLTSPIRGKPRPGQADSSPHKLDYRWISLPNGKVGVSSIFRDSVYLSYNPSELDRGYNIFPNTDELTCFLVTEVLPEIECRVPELHLSQPEWNRVKVGRADLSMIHLAADWEFPSRQALEACFRNLKRSWKWRWNRRAYRRYSTTYYINQTHWDLVSYVKDDEVAANHANWPEAIKRRSRNRLRVELKLRREELLCLGERLTKLHPEMPLLDLGSLREWDDSLYPLVFDLYARRITSKHSDNIDTRGADIQLYHFLRKYGGLPVYPRREHKASPICDD